jgi:hypothetical protein
MAMQLQCPVCQELLPFEHWRVLADHAACQKPVPSAPEAGHAQEGGAVSFVTEGVDRLMRAVAGIVTAMNPGLDREQKEPHDVEP